jgi:hypothetical protein
MRARGVVVVEVIGEVGSKQAPEMAFVEHDEMIEAFPADRADQSAPGRDSATARGRERLIPAAMLEAVGAVAQRVLPETGSNLRKQAPTSRTVPWLAEQSAARGIRRRRR